MLMPLAAQHRSAPARWRLLAWVLPPQVRLAVLSAAAQLVHLAHFEPTGLFPVTGPLATASFWVS